ncbi:hypothetical protein LTR93_011164 [Exophiala xenobiotica]|nr:hypothetical protein LTR93_011164 [Exophiala xenobiotica]
MLKETDRAAAVVKSNSPFASPCPSPSVQSSSALRGEVRPRDQTIWQNQVGHLTSSTDSQARYYSSVSWVSALKDWEHTSPSTTEGDGKGSTPWREQDPIAENSCDSIVGHISPLVSLDEFDRLICWYAEYCHLGYPIRAQHPWSQQFAYIASCSAEACSNIKTFTLTSAQWFDNAQMLAKSLYPSRPNPSTIRAAFLMAVPNITEVTSNASFSPISVLARAAQFLGLHREPLALHASSNSAEFRRVLWWSIQSLGIGYSLAHALPPLVHPTNSDVRMLSTRGRLNRRLLISLIRVSNALAKILEDIHDIRQPTLATLQRLDKDVEDVCSSEAMGVAQTNSSPTERFLVPHQRACCWKLQCVVHQPYLRSTQWPQSSRRKALDACKRYISDFSKSITEPALAPYRWILNHFNVFHACAVILRDLVQYP